MKKCIGREYPEQTIVGTPLRVDLVLRRQRPHGLYQYTVDIVTLLQDLLQITKTYTALDEMQPFSTAEILSTHALKSIYCRLTY